MQTCTDGIDNIRQCGPCSSTGTINGYCSGLLNLTEHIFKNNSSAGSYSNYWYNPKYTCEACGYVLTRTSEECTLTTYTDGREDEWSHGCHQPTAYGHSASNVVCKLCSGKGYTGTKSACKHEQYKTHTYCQHGDDVFYTMHD